MKRRLIYFFFYINTWVDVLLHLLDPVPFMNWFTGSNARCEFCQWCWEGWWRYGEDYDKS